MTVDAELLQRVAGGDSGAFDEFVERHQDAVWRYVRALAPNQECAEDALQECFLAVWRSAGGFRGTGSARGWLMRIARNALWKLGRLRAGEPRDKQSLEELLAAGRQAGWGSQDGQAALEGHDAIHVALERLPAIEREAIVLRDLQGWSGEEAASLLEISLAALKSRLHRARLHLLAELRQEVRL